jgi:hypothetical protein
MNATTGGGATDDGDGDGRGGISCMDLDRGGDDGGTPRYLLVGSGGYDRSIALYDISYYGSDMHLHRGRDSSTTSSSHASSAATTHRPIARSIGHRQSAGEQRDGGGGAAASDVPSGHRHPVLGVHWYPGELTPRDPPSRRASA